MLCYRNHPFLLFKNMMQLFFTQEHLLGLQIVWWPSGASLVTKILQREVVSHSWLKLGTNAG